MTDFNGRARSILAPQASLRPQARPEVTQGSQQTQTPQGTMRPEPIQSVQIPVGKEREDLFNLFTQMLGEYRRLSDNPTQQPPSENPDRQFYQSTVPELSRFGGVAETSDAQVAIPAPSKVTVSSLDGAEVPKNVLAPKGPAYKDSQVVSYSYYKRPIEGSGARGNSRRGGDAPEEVQKAAINAIISEGRKAGMSNEDIALTLSIARHESGFNPDAAAGTTSAHGLGQFVNKTGEAYGLNDENRWDVNEQARALVEHTKDNIRLAERKGQGREYVYAYHHDGPSLAYGGLQIGQKNVTPKVSQFLGIVEGQPSEDTTTPKESLRPVARPEQAQ